MSGRSAGGCSLPKSKAAAVVDQAPRLAVLDDVELHRRREDEAAMQAARARSRIFSSLQTAVPGLRRIARYCSKVRLAKASGSAALGGLNGDLASSRAMSSTLSGAKRASAAPSARPRRALSSATPAAANAPPKAQLEEFPTRALCHDALRSRCGAPLADDGLAGRADARHTVP